MTNIVVIGCIYESQSQNLCKPPLRCTIEAPYLLFVNAIHTITLALIADLKAVYAALPMSSMGKYQHAFSVSAGGFLADFLKNALSYYSKYNEKSDRQTA